MLLLDLHTDFSGGRWGGLVFLSLEFSTVCCDLHRHATVHGVAKSWTWLSDWTEPNTVKGFGIINKAEVNVFLELFCFFDDPADIGNLISGSSVFYKSNLEFLSLHTVEAWLGEFWALLSSVWDECNCVVVWMFFGLSLGLEWKLNFSSPVASAEFSKFSSILSATLSQHHL